MRAYELTFHVGLEETNLVGNVYFVNHIRWQGRVREMFLREHCPDILQELQRGLALVTLRCSCEYLLELEAFDEVLVRMRLMELVQNRISFSFDYLIRRKGDQELAARGAQEVACMRRVEGERLQACPIPESLRRALESYH